MNTIDETNADTAAIGQTASGPRNTIIAAGLAVFAAVLVAIAFFTSTASSSPAHTPEPTVTSTVIETPAPTSEAPPVEAEPGSDDVDTVDHADAVVDVADPPHRTSETSTAGCDEYSDRPALPLRRCDSGVFVSDAQWALAMWGAELNVDGYFGQRTEVAVRDFQAAHGLAVDGVVGPQTWGVLVQQFDDVNVEGDGDVWVEGDDEWFEEDDHEWLEQGDHEWLEQDDHEWLMDATEE